MLLKPLKKSDVKKILVISLSNIGDVILTFPVVDVLKEEFPSARLSMVVGPKAFPLVKINPLFDKVYVFDKHQSGLTTVRWVKALRREGFDLVVDLRNTAIPLLLSPKYRTPIRRTKTEKQHMKNRHLARLCSVLPFIVESKKRFALVIPDQERKTISDLLNPFVRPEEPFVIIGPGAANHLKRWASENFAKLSDALTQQYGWKIVFVGDANDRDIVEKITTQKKFPALNLAGKTTLLQLAALLEKSSLAIVNDSAIMHLASYLNIPVLALFGPTDSHKYGPWSGQSRVVRKNIFCSPCQKSGCAHDHSCMTDIGVEDCLAVIHMDGANIVLKPS